MGEVASRYCPLLKREVTRLYVCTALNIDVNPLIMPCLSNYKECVVYKSNISQRKEKETVSKTTTLAETSQAVKTEKETVEKPIEDLSKLEQILKEFYEDSVKLRQLSDEYNKVVKRLREHYKEIQKYMESIPLEIGESQEIAT